MPTSPPAASAQQCRRPMPTRSAPSAIALTMSEPRQNEPSTMILARPATALTISGSRCLAPRPWSSWRPPCVDTDVQSTPRSGESGSGVLGGGDALDHERYLELVLDQLDGAPVQPLLEVAAGGADAAGADIALGDIALASAVIRGVHRQADRAV